MVTCKTLSHLLSAHPQDDEVLVAAYRGADALDGIDTTRSCRTAPGTCSW